MFEKEKKLRDCAFLSQNGLSEQRFSGGLRGKRKVTRRRRAGGGVRKGCTRKKALIDSRKRSCLRYAISKKGTRGSVFEEKKKRSRAHRPSQGTWY